MSGEGVWGEGVSGEGVWGEAEVALALTGLCTTPARDLLQSMGQLGEGPPITAAAAATAAGEEVVRTALLSLEGLRTRPKPASLNERLMTGGLSLRRKGLLLTGDCPLAGGV